LILYIIVLHNNNNNEMIFIQSVFTFFSFSSYQLIVDIYHYFYRNNWNNFMFFRFFLFRFVLFCFVLFHFLKVNNKNKNFVSYFIVINRFINLKMKYWKFVCFLFCCCCCCCWQLVVGSWNRIELQTKIITRYEEKQRFKEIKEDEKRSCFYLLLLLLILENKENY
jgi:hypothetical protein